MERTWYMLTAIVFLMISLLSLTSALECNQTASPMRYNGFPSVYDNTPAVTPGTSGCGIVRTTDIECDYSVILGDGVMVPSPPDLTSVGYLRRFIAWQRDSNRLYVDFTGVPGLITAIELSFLNSPVNRISLPDIQLFRVTRYGTTFATDDLQLFPSTILDNEELTQSDSQVRTVTLRPTISNSGPTFRISFEFTEFHDFDWFFLSEVRFCTEPYPLPALIIMFQAPPSTIVQPSADDLRNGSTELVCTVSSQGYYTWQWRKDNTVIGNGNPNYGITIGDGSRTTKLTISNLDLSDAGQYRCTATAMDGVSSTGSESLLQEIQFPETLTAPDANGYLQTGVVTLSCELHGYQSSFSPPVWLNMDGSEIATSAKYTISSSDGMNTIVLEDGTTLPSVVVSLTIHTLTSADEGNYTCRGVRGESVVSQLTVLGGTAPPTTPPTTPTTVTVTVGPTVNNTESMEGPGGSSIEPGVLAAAVVVTFIILITLLGIAAVAGVFVYIKIRDDRYNISPTPHGNSYIEVNPKRRLTKNDIEWQLTSSENNSDSNIYSVVDKSTQRNSVVPSVPPQHFDETDFTSMGFENQEAEPEYEDGELYRQPGLKPPRRRLTNSTKPKLAKITTVDPQSSMDSNPIYESAAILCKSSKAKGLLDANPLYAEPDRNSFTTTVSTTSGGEPVYSEALNPSQILSNNSSKSNGEPVYSEALNPLIFNQDHSPLIAGQSGQSGSTEEDLLPYGPVYEEPSTAMKLQRPLSITYANICEQRELGVGQFGEVVLAETVELSEKELKLGDGTDKNARLLVAVKKLKDKADISMKESFEKEIKFMSSLSDNNIVKLLAVCNEEPKFIVIEYMENGDLFQFLNNHELATSMDALQPSRLSVSTLLRMAIQISSGMRYLASLKYVHRDLASRNCLVGKNYLVKISDFGMSRNLYESVYYRVRGRAMLPIRWMATESFYGRFSEKTDVWSFGVTMWEIFTLGRHQPYEELDDQDIIQDAVRSKQRKLLVRPEACPEDVYKVMLRCWEYKLDDRASFAEIFTSLDEIHKQM